VPFGLLKSVIVVVLVDIVWKLCYVFHHCCDLPLWQIAFVFYAGLFHWWEMV